MAAVGVKGFAKTFVHSLDSKKRLTIPAVWREVVGVPKMLYVLPGIKVRCLCVYPAREFDCRLEKLRTLSIGDLKGRQLLRTLASRSDQLTWDSQGRIRISDELLEYADLQNQVVLSAAFDTFELWNPDLWKQQAGVMDDEALAEALKYIGL
ncbi:MAG: hypothetical protein JXB04_03785 [Kiritimatiellae bacterium]|nr:hypothetical protein [Kiritimatiellia bacterium]